MMSSDVIIDTVPCLPYRRHLVPVPSSSRIGYRMISQRNPSHAIPDTTTSRSSPRPSHRSSPYCFPPRFPPHRVAPRVDSRHDYTLPACLFISPHLIGLSPVPPRFPSCFPPSVPPRFVPPNCPSYVPSVACPSRHLIHLIGSSHRNATSDKTSDEQAKRRTGRAIDDGVRRTLRHPTSRRQRKCPSPPAV